MFIPPHCPNPKCPNYQAPADPQWYQKDGAYPTETFGAVPRFKCKKCRRGFSKQTFSIDYYAKRILDYRYIYNQVNAGAGIRNIARDLEVKARAVTNRINRMGRNATLINQALAHCLKLQEDLVFDGLENFCPSQFFPDNATIMVGKDSQFIFECDYASLRRKGRMTPLQKKRRAILEQTFRPSPRAVEFSFRRLLESLAHREDERTLPLILYTDEKKDYQRALWKTKAFNEPLYSGQWRHHQINSKEPRTIWNPLFSANYIDREIRKDMACHARESVQFPRNASNLMLRMNLYLYDHNVRKPYRIKDTAAPMPRHAHVAGVESDELNRLTWGFFTKRFFREVGQWLSPSAVKTLRRQWVTPLKKKPERLWKYLAP